MESLLVSLPWVEPVLSALGALVVIAQIVVALTPSKRDDEILQQASQGAFKFVFDFLLSFAPIQKKDGKLKLSK